MKNRLIPLGDRLLLQKRAIIESVFDPLKNISQPVAFPPSQPGQLLGQHCLWTNCLLPPASEAFDALEHNLLPSP
ncbi:MAG: transposase [Gloeocapsa sp. UFS-A4-WI-NPMV-4B04]|nr:transposase [Gloeocapsa sp. UFS-A4-WI-NPMV-4B04]